MASTRNPRTPRRAPLTPDSDTLLERLLTLHPKRIDLSLDRIERLLAALDHPERRLPPVVHVAGTNGKGSAIAFLRAILGAAGWRVHAYTSPHLVRFHERIELAGRPIEEGHLADVLARAEAANAGADITFFEITTAAAFLAFAETPADVLLLETGLGGRLDATNVVTEPALTALTQIAKDHEGFLGDDLAGIATEKTGILKEGVPCFSVRQGAMPARVVRARAEAVGAPLYQEGRAWSTRRNPDGSMVYEGPFGRRDLPEPALAGGHQTSNAALAVALAEHLPDRLGVAPVPDSAMALGLRTAAWPGRLQRLTHGPLVDSLPEGFEVWLDGGHNPAAGKALAQVLRGWRDSPLYGVIGMLDTKHTEGFLKPVAPRFRRVHTVPVPGSAAALDPEPLAETAAACGADARPAADVTDAVRRLAAQVPPGRILICGSLYLAGAVLRAMEDEEEA